MPPEQQLGTEVQSLLSNSPTIHFSPCEASLAMRCRRHHATKLHVFGRKKRHAWFEQNIRVVVERIMSDRINLFTNITHKKIRSNNRQLLSKTLVSDILQDHLSVQSNREMFCVSIVMKVNADVKIYTFGATTLHHNLIRKLQHLRNRGYTERIESAHSIHEFNV